MMSLKKREYLLWLSVLLFLIGGAALLWSHRDLPWIEQNAFSAALAYVGIGTLCVTGFYYAFWGVSVLLYRPAPVMSDGELPGCTVLVPAYNEGRHVAETLTTLLASDYPADKFRIIAINDGSKDDTWSWIERTAAASDGRITPINLERNGGKKHALCIGIRAAQTPVIVTVDSDSIVEPSTLRHLVSPFRRADVGAVAGNVQAKNRHVNFITEMLDVVLIFGCDFMRAAQSITGCVVCTPGALSAYRREVILPHLTEWLTQSFLGSPATIGEDRAITTLILRDGYRVVHQSSAIAETCMPESYTGLSKMLLRWTRSDIRENFMMVRFLFDGSLFRNARQRWLLLHWVALTLNVTLPIVFVPLFLYLLFQSVRPLDFLVFNVLMAFATTLVPAMVYISKRSLRETVWAMLYSVFNLTALSWICIYSFFTMRNSKGLTRELPTHRRTAMQRYSLEAQQLYRGSRKAVKRFLLSRSFFY